MEIEFEHVPTECNMQCVSFCLEAKLSKPYESVQEVYEFCLLPQCNCKTGQVDYVLKEERPQVEPYSFISFPKEYDSWSFCDMPCAHDCMGISEHLSVGGVDICLASKCGCYLSAASYDICSDSCKEMCILESDNISECMYEQCHCHEFSKYAAFWSFDSLVDSIEKEAVAYVPKKE